MTKKVVDLAAKTVTWKFDDNTETVFELAKCESDMATQLALHGASQKGGDSYAGAGDSPDPTAYAKAAVADTIKQLYSTANGGENTWRASAGPGTPRISDLATALSRLTGKTVDEANAFVESLTDEEKKTWRAKGKVRAELAKIAVEKATAKANRLAAVAGSEGEAIAI